MLVAAKVVNRGSARLTGLAVRLDLPAGLVATYTKVSRKGPLVVPDTGANTSAAYWTGLSLGPRKGRFLKLPAEACATAAPGSQSVGGTDYAVNATGDATCLGPDAAPVAVNH